MLTLGFTNHFYTLWNVTTRLRYGAGAVVNGVFTGETWLVTKYSYMQNLSMDYEDAKAKIERLSGGTWEEDLSLRGEHGSSFTRTVRQINAMADWQFTFGKLTGHDIREATDTWQLSRAMHAEIGGRRRVYARQRLLQLGFLVRYDWEETLADMAAWDKLLTEVEAAGKDPYAVNTIAVPTRTVKRKYATTKQAAFMEKKKAEAELSGHFFENGKRIQLQIKEVGRFSFDSAYGTTFIVKYMTASGKLVKYMGSTPPDVSTEDFTPVTATIKHSDYKGQPETKLQRIKRADAPKVKRGKIVSAAEDQDWQAFDDNLDWMTDAQASAEAEKIRTRYDKNNF